MKKTLSFFIAFIFFGLILSSVFGNSSFVLRSSAVANGGQLPIEYTGDGASATLPLEWSGAPKETKSFAVIMHHVLQKVIPSGIGSYTIYHLLSKAFPKI